MIGLMFVLFAESAIAGTQLNPEILDVGEPDNGDSGEDDDDIRRAWFGPEHGDCNGSFINGTLEMHSLPPVQTGLSTLEYEVYFTTATNNWAVVSIFNFGTGWTQAGFELRTVTYDEDGNLTSETSSESIDGDVNENNATITYQIPADSIGAVPAGALSHTWAAVWATPLGGGDRELRDEAHNYTMPGLDYHRIGVSYPQTVFKEEVVPGSSADFTVVLHNPGELEVSVVCNNTYDFEWELTIAVNAETQADPEFEVLVPLENNLSIIVILDVPEDPEAPETINGTPSLSFNLVLSYTLFNCTETVYTQEITLTTMINISADGPDGTDGDDDDDDDGWLPGFEAVLIALAIPAAVLLSRKR